MEVWQNEHGALVDFSNVARAPCKDFYHVFVTPTEVIFRYWKIVPPTRVDSLTSPVEICNSYGDFLYDDRCQSEIQRLAGNDILQYLIRLAEGHLDFLPRLPDKILKKIILDLDLEEIVCLGATSQKFSKLCNSDDVWEKIFHREVETPITPELKVLAEKEGWKRLFYTNKLQLQSKIRWSNCRGNPCLTYLDQISKLPEHRQTVRFPAEDSQANYDKQQMQLRRQKRIEEQEEDHKM